MNFPILSTIIFLPLLGAAFIFLSSQKVENKSGVYISIVSYLILFMIFIKLILDKKNVQKTTK